jgi:rRNA small subunit pseudouridine methyltransferase Nep1
LHLVLAESSVELVPREIAEHPAVLSWAHRKRKDPEHLILDQSYHHAAIQRLGREGLGRGRPDITHFCLLLALGSPLNMAGQLRTIVHTRDDKAIIINSRARLPRSTDRFVALLEQLYEEKAVPPQGPPLMSLENKSLSTVISEIGGDNVIALTTQGAFRPLTEIAKGLLEHKKPVLLVGGFSEGHFSRKTMKLANEAFRIDKRRLEAWTVVARAVYDYERAVAVKAPEETTLM